LSTPAVHIPDKMFFRIGEVSEITGVKPYVLRYWESEFRLLRPSKNKSGQRVYRRREVETVLEIKDLLHRRKFTIAGAKKWLAGEGRQAPAERQMELGFAAADRSQVMRRVREGLVSLEKMLE
jgi:DNA-binding transcriptional MerR regulator